MFEVGKTYRSLGGYTFDCVYANRDFAFFQNLKADTCTWERQICFKNWQELPPEPTAKYSKWQHQSSFGQSPMVEGADRARALHPHPGVTLRYDYEEYHTSLGINKKLVNIEVIYRVGK